MNLDIDKIINLTTAVQQKATAAVIAINEMLPVLIVSLEQFKEYMEAAKEQTAEANPRETMINFVHEQIGGNRDIIASWNDDTLTVAYESLSQRQGPDEYDENKKSS